MIGNKADAQIAYDVTTQFTSLPDGWGMIGSGGYRVAYLSPDNVVYKVGSEWANRAEVKNSHAFFKRALKTEMFRIPRANLHRVVTISPQEYYSGWVVAMEYVPPSGRFFRCNRWFGSFVCDCGQTPCIDEWRMQAKKMFGLVDVHYENVLIGQDGKFWIVDLGE